MGWDPVPHGCLKGRSSGSKTRAGACGRAPSPVMPQLLGGRIRLLFASFRCCAFGITDSLSCLGLSRVSGWCRGRLAGRWRDRKLSAFEKLAQFYQGNLTKIFCSAGRCQGCRSRIYPSGESASTFLNSFTQEQGVGPASSVLAHLFNSNSFSLYLPQLSMQCQ